MIVYSDPKGPGSHRIGYLLEIQRKIASKVAMEDDYSTEFIAGVDQAFVDDLIISGAVVLGSSFQAIDYAGCIMRAVFPYIPGLLSFREGPAAIKAARNLKSRPTLLFVDGCGINHPRRAGLASFIGIMLDVATIGITKNVLCGQAEMPEKAGMATSLIFNGVQVGHLLKSKKGCRPIVIAPGHRVSMQSSLKLTRKYLIDSKLPEPIRLAHLHANRIKRKLELERSLESRTAAGL